VRKSYDNPLETYEINVMGTSYLLDAVRRLENPCKVVIITTDKVYENREIDYPYKEEDPLGGFDPYSSSKACAEIATASYRRSFFHPDKYNDHKKAIATARAGNVIGGGDWSMDRIIPDIVCSLQEQKLIEVRNPDAVRPWQFVLEPIAGYLQLAGLLHNEPGKYGTAYNFGPLPEDHLTVKELVETAIKYWGNGTWKDVSSHREPHEAGLLKLDISLAKKDLSWQPKLNADEAIKWTIDWYKQPPEQQASFTFQEVKEFFDL
jgi:CDP-glucose 4,6-dehydratase